MPKIKMKIKGEIVEKDFPGNHCLFCKYWPTNINEQPCRECLNSGEVPGRNRPLFKEKEESDKIMIIDSSEPSISNKQYQIPMKKKKPKIKKLFQ